MSTDLAYDGKHQHPEVAFRLVTGEIRAAQNHTQAETCPAAAENNGNVRGNVQSAGRRTKIADSDPVKQANKTTIFTLRRKKFISALFHH
jgi:hypothetical protein